MSFALRKSTAGQVVQFKMVDSTTGLKKTGLTIANTDIKLVFEAGTSQTSKNSGGATEIGSTGVYYMTLNATDTATLGKLRLDIEVAGALPWFADLMVLTAAAWDALHAASGGYIPADVTRLLGTAWLTPAVAGTPDVNAKQLNGQTASLNANNLLKVSLNDILATALTETSGQLAGGFKQFFNVATPTGTVNSLPNAVAGASGGVFIAGTNDHCTITNNLLVSGNATVSGTTTLTGNVALSDGLTITCSTTNRDALSLTGNGTGCGVLAQGGSNGHGGSFTSGASAGQGITIVGQVQYGLRAAGVSAGLYCTGTAASGVGAYIQGFNASTSNAAGEGLVIIGGNATTTSGGTSAVGVRVRGGNGAASNNGASDGIYSIGGGTTTVSGGNGINATGTGNLNGISGTGTGTGNGIYGLGGNGTSGDGAHFVGGTGASNGLNCIGGGTSGAGIAGTGTTNDAGMTLTHAGTGKDLNATTTNALQVDLNTIKTQTLTCSAGVTVGAFVGNATAALAVDASGRVDIGKALGTAVTLDSNNVLNVSAKYWAGTAITATSIPVATAAGASGGLLISGSNSGTTTLGALTVTGALTAGSTVLGNTTMGTLTQTGAVSWGATTFSSLTVTTTTTLTGNVTLSGTLGVGATTLSALTVTNNLLVSGTATVTGATTFTGAVTASNASNNIVGIDVAKAAGVAWASGAITAASIATDAIDADALAADAVTEIWSKAMKDLSAVPGITASVLDAINWMFELARDKVTQTATTQTVFKDDGSTALATSTVSDNGTTFTRGAFS